MLPRSDRIMSKLRRKPTKTQNINAKAKYQVFQLTENPFPTCPVNKNSTDPRINGNIYEPSIRSKEYDQIKEYFLTKPQADPAHLRMGYICDTSYIGRGNGKSTFLVNLINNINYEYCLDISNDLNKCFALYIVPEPGGRTKSFDSFIDLIFKAIYSSKIIDFSLASLKIRAISELYPNIIKDDYKDDKLMAIVSSKEELEKLGIKNSELMNHIWKNEFLQKIPNSFPIFKYQDTFFDEVIDQEDFLKTYKDLKKGREKLDFVFSHLVLMFMASDFNGAYIFVDDFERIPDFQSGRQKRDFVTELRSVLLDGSYENAIFGFFNMLLVLHAGVPALISEAWASSGVDQRYPLSPQHVASHFIPFEKLSSHHATSLVSKYLKEYRNSSFTGSAIDPFSSDAIKLIAENCEYNAAKILKTCAEMVEKAIADNITIIDKKFVHENMGEQDVPAHDELSINNPNAIDLVNKAKDTKY